MVDKPKKGKGKLVGKKKSVKKASPSAAPVEQGSGLNVESKPKLQSQSIQEKQEAKLAEKVKSHREQEDAKNLTQMKASKPKESSSFHSGMKAFKKKKAANKGLLEGMAKAAKEFPGPENEKKQLAAINMTSKMAKAGKEFRDAQEKDTKPSAIVTDPMAAKLEAFAKGSTGFSANEKMIVGMTQAGKQAAKQAKDKKQKKLDAFKNVGAKAKSAFTGPNKPKKSEGFLSGIENLLGEIDAHNNKKSGKPYSLPKPPASSQKSPAGFRQNAKNAFQKMKTDKLNKGKAASDPTLKNPFSGRTKQSSEDKHNSPERGPIYKGEHTTDKKRSVGESTSAFKKGAATPQSSSPSLASKVGGAIKKVATSPTTTGILKATGAHLAMAAMHGTNYPRVMQQHASQGPREFKPGWHGFTSPVERPKAEEGTDTKGERA